MVSVGRRDLGALSWGNELRDLRRLATLLGPNELVETAIRAKCDGLVGWFVLTSARLMVGGAMEPRAIPLGEIVGAEGANRDFVLTLDSGERLEFHAYDDGTAERVWALFAEVREKGVVPVGEPPPLEPWTPTEAQRRRARRYSIRPFFWFLIVAVAVMPAVVAALVAQVLFFPVWILLSVGGVLISFKVGKRDRLRAIMLEDAQATLERAPVA